MGLAAGMMCGGTLGGVTAGVGCGNGSVDCVCLCVCSDLVLASVAPVVREKISANYRSACICVCAMGENGVAGCGFRSAAVSSAAASRAASADVVAGMLYRYGKNSTVRAIRSARVFGM